MRLLHPGHLSHELLCHLSEGFGTLLVRVLKSLCLCLLKDFQLLLMIGLQPLDFLVRCLNHLLDLSLHLLLMVLLEVGHLRHELLGEFLDPIRALPPDLIEPLVLLALKGGHLRLVLRSKGC
jgi:hypothetical protein